MRQQCTKCNRERPTFIADPSCPKGGYCNWCSKLAAGWQSPVEVNPGHIMVVPCPECGVIHRTRPADVTAEQLRKAFVDPYLESPKGSGRVFLSWETIREHYAKGSRQ